MNEEQKETLKMLERVCREIARIRKCSVGAEEFTYEELDAHIGKIIEEQVKKYENMSAQEMAIELAVEVLVKEVCKK